MKSWSFCPPPPFRTAEAISSRVQPSFSATAITALMTVGRLWPTPAVTAVRECPATWTTRPKSPRFGNASEIASRSSLNWFLIRMPIRDLPCDSGRLHGSDRVDLADEVLVHRRELAVPADFEAANRQFLR